jgi:hypothetical protein
MAEAETIGRIEQLADRMIANAAVAAYDAG